MFIKKIHQNKSIKNDQYFILNELDKTMGMLPMKAEINK